ncbi:MAG: MmpS family protein [Chloroflexota bacterium]|nr:MmpS family protein [Chloroflexota bacterium]
MRWLMVMLVVVLAGCGGSDNGDATAPDADSTATRSEEQTEVASVRATPTPTNVTVQPTMKGIEYVITGRPAAVVSLTYQNASGGTSQETGVRTPWSKTMTMQSGDFAYVSAQGNEFAAEITCEIWVDGVVGATSTSAGKFVVATCSGTIP